MDSPDRASNDQSILEGAFNEAGAPLEEGIPAGGPSNVNEIGEEAPSGVATKTRRKRLPNRVLLSTYVPPPERIHPPTGMVAHDPEGAWEIIQHWSPFN